MTSLKTSLSLLGAGALAVSLAACTSAAPTTTQAATTSNSASAADQGSASATASASGSASASGTDDKTAAALQAIATAEAASSGVAHSIDDEDDDGTWEVDVLVGNDDIEYKISADGTQVVSQDHDDDGIDDGERAALDAAQVTLSQAITIAVDARGAALDDADLNEGDFDTDDDDDNEAWAWEISLVGIDDVYVDPATGALLN